MNHPDFDWDSDREVHLHDYAQTRAPRFFRYIEQTRIGIKYRAHKPGKLDMTLFDNCYLPKLPMMLYSAQPK